MKLKKIFILGLCFNFIYAALSGAASTPVPKISATPASVNFGTVVIGASSALKIITVKNTGKSDLIVDSVDITGTDSDEFSQTNSCGTIQPGGSCLVNVTFTPNIPFAKKTATLAIASNDPRKSPLNVKLSGLLPPPAISAAPASLNFGKLPEGTVIASKSVTVKNNGLSDLMIESIDISGANPGDFTATNNCGTIQKNGSCTINVLFEPLAPNVTRSASLDISSNDPKKSKVSLKLTGSSTGAKSPPAAPTGVTGTPGNGQATISWTAVSGATSYNIFWSTTPGVTKSTGTKISGVTSPYTHSSLTNGTPYYYVVTAVNTNGESAESTQVSITPVQAAPSAPTEVTATAGIGQVSLSWKAVTGATSYTIYWSTSPGVTKANGTKISAIAASPYKQTGLTNGITYYYNVTANSGSAESAPSDEVSAKPSLDAGVKLLKMSVYKGELLQAYITYEYDASDRMVKVSSYDFAGNLTGYSTYEYNSANNVTKMSVYILGGVLVGYITTEYDENQNIVKLSSYSSFGDTLILTGYITNEYDEAENMIKTSSYNGITGKLIEYATYEYNAKGKETKESKYDFAGNLTEYTTTEYNAAGKEVKKSSYGPTGLIDTYVTTEYNAAGKKVKKSTYNGLTEKLIKYTTYEYNAEGKESKQSNYDFADNLTGYTTSEYNEAGMPVKIAVYDDTGLLKTYTTFEYGN